MNWIKCSDRMPPRYDYVIVCGEGSLGYLPMQFAQYDGEKWGFIGCSYDVDCIEGAYSDCGDNLYRDNIKFWMPLPEAPEN